VLKDIQTLKSNKTNQANNTKLRLSVLIPNIKGWETAINVAIPDEILIFTAASEAFCQKNINCSITESIERFKPVVERAKQLNVHVRASISCSLGCPYEDMIEPAQVVSVAKQLVAMGCTELSIADTIGVGTPLRVAALFQQLQDALPDVLLGGHFHDTYGQAIANVLAALQQGVSVFHGAVAGLGGCPYAPGASGNISSEDAIHMLDAMGYDTGINIPKLIGLARELPLIVGHPVPGQVAKAGSSCTLHPAPAYVEDLR
jgi:hydroxymethylglutaryl-CoA lyase